MAMMKKQARIARYPNPNTKSSDTSGSPKSAIFWVSGSVASRPYPASRDGSRIKLTFPPPPANEPRLHERIDEGFAECRVRLDDPDPKANVQDLLEDMDDVVAAAESRPKTQEHNLDADEDREETIGRALQPAVATREGGDEVLQG